MRFLTRLCLAAAVLLSCACGGTPGASAPGDTAAELPEDTQVADDLPEVLGPPEFGPQVRWKIDPDPAGSARVLAEEQWLLPFVAQDGVREHGLTYWTGRDMVADAGRAYVITTGPVGGVTPTAGFLHAVDAEGTEHWRLGLPVLHSMESASLAIDREGALIAARANQAGPFHPTSSFVAKVNRDAKVLWDVRVYSHPDDPSEHRDHMSRVALDEENNLYYGIGLTVASLGPDGELRWSRLLAARAASDWNVAGAPAVVGDTVWSVGPAGVYAFSRDGDVKVWRPGGVRSDSPEREPHRLYLSVGAVLPSGKIVGTRDGLFDLLDASGSTVSTTSPFPIPGDAALVVGPDGIVVGLNGYIDAVEGETLLWRVGYVTGRAEALIDDRGQAVVLASAGHHLDLYDVQTGDRIGAYDIGRAGSGPLGVVLREGELIVPVMLEATDGRRVAALQCVKVPVGLPAPGLWSHKHGDQRLSRSYTPTPIEVDDPSPEPPEPDPPSEAR